MLNNGYIVLYYPGSQLALPNPVKFSESRGKESKSYKLENGSTVEHYKSSSYDCSMTLQVSSFWKGKLLGLPDNTSYTVTVNGESHAGLIIGAKSVELVANSERTAGTNGLWNVSLSFSTNG